MGNSRVSKHLKKGISLALTLFIIWICTESAQAGMININVRGSTLGGYTKTYVGSRTGTRHTNDTFMLYVNGGIAFCLQCGYGIPGFSGSSGNSYLSYAADVVEKNSLQNKIAYLGWYGSDNRSDQDYAFTQMYLWKTLPEMPASGNKTVSFVSPVINAAYLSWKAKIDNKLNRWNIRPSFDHTLSNQTFFTDPGKSICIYDNNGVLEDYGEFDFEKEGITVSHRKGDSFINVAADEDISPKTIHIDDDEFAGAGGLKYDSMTSGNYVYSSGVSQNLGVYGMVEPVLMDLSIQIRSQKLKVIHVDKETGKSIEMEDAIFRLEDDKGRKQSFSTGADGIGWSEELTAGKYKLSEVKQNHGYIKETEPVEFILDFKLNGGLETKDGIVTLPFLSKPQRSKISITQEGIYHYGLQEKKEFLANVVFEIKAEEDIMSPDKKTVFAYCGQVIETIVTDKDGNCKSGDLWPGKYIIFQKEIIGDRRKIYKIMEKPAARLDLKSCCDGTALNDTQFSFINNAPTTELSIVKKDRVTGEKLKGAEIAVFDENENQIARENTDKEGTALFEDLGQGIYYYQEIEAPKGYDVDCKKYKIEVLGESNKISAVITDEKLEESNIVMNKTGMQTPDTGDRKSLLQYIVTVVLAVGITIIMAAKRKI